MNPAGQKSLARELGIPRQVLDRAATAAYDYLLAGVFDESIAMSQGLVAADAANWYYRQLLATALHQRRNDREALRIIDEGLSLVPDNPQLQALRGTVAAALSAEDAPLAVPAVAPEPTAGPSDLASFMTQQGWRAGSHRG